MTISGGLVDRVIAIREAVVVLRNLSIVNGKAESFGGAFLCYAASSHWTIRS
jgi:hypothetical protein